MMPWTGPSYALSNQKPVKILKTDKSNMENDNEPAAITYNNSQLTETLDMVTLTGIFIMVS